MNRERAVIVIYPASMQSCRRSMEVSQKHKNVRFARKLLRRPDECALLNPDIRCLPEQG